jgi:hypothetical protein
VPEISQHEVQVRQGFTGADLLLFGAILSPKARARRRIMISSWCWKGRSVDRAAREAEGRRHVDQRRQHRVPLRPQLLRDRLVAPDARIVDDKTAAIYELGLKWLQLSPIG